MKKIKEYLISMAVTPEHFGLLCLIVASLIWDIYFIVPKPWSVPLVIGIFAYEMFILLCCIIKSVDGIIQDVDPWTIDNQDE